MAKKTTKKTAEKTIAGLQLRTEWRDPLAQAPESFLTHPVKAAADVKLLGRLFVVGKVDPKKLAGKIEEMALPSARAQILADLGDGKEVIAFQSLEGPVWLIARRPRPAVVSHGGQLEESDYAWYRDRVGAWMVSQRTQAQAHFEVVFEQAGRELILGALVGIELAMYSYKNLITGVEFAKAPSVELRGIQPKQKEAFVAQALARARAQNLARHLVNTPPNELNPATMEKFVAKHFKGRAGTKVTVWDAERLRAEKMGLMLGVGGGSENPPRLIHIRYRPTETVAKKTRKPVAPVAFVGKGITFDTGGLDIKPSSGMRLMKKDMGGSATVLALADWATRVQYPKPLDFYLAMAENAVDERAFRPSDVLVARNGLAVEIHNTDAEGRLVLADAIDVAITQTGADEPSAVIDVATLTGAIKVALGADIGGLFSNHDPLAAELERAGSEAGDLNWRMPLFNKYANGFSSAFADLVNSVDGFAGPITAALFLEKFVNRKPWAHLDVYCWNDRAEGPYSFSGGNGQSLQSLIQFLENRR